VIREKIMHSAADEGSIHGRKTVLRSLRLPEELSRDLEMVAEEDGTTFNAIASSVLNEYVTWTRKARKSGFVYVTKDFLKLVLDVCDEEKLKGVLSEGKGDVWKDLIMFWYQGVTPESVMKFFEELGQHSLYLNVSSKIEGTNYAITLNHDLGERFSFVLRARVNRLLTQSLHVQPAFEEGENSLIVRFSAPFGR
jgi:hypothetical protein